MSLTRGARTSILIIRYCQHNMARPAGMATFIHDKHRGLATKTEGYGNDATRSPAADSNEDHSNSKGKYNKPGSTYRLSWISCSCIALLVTDEVSNTLELPKSTPATDGTKEHDEYYSLKMHREGPNTESGELDPKSKSKEVKYHNKAMADRYDKR